MKQGKEKKIFGFTLIELLVVIAVMGLLTAIILPSFTVARKRGRVAQRISDMKQVETSLAFYYAVNRTYPTTGGAWRSVCSGYGSYTANNVIPGLVPTFISVFPSDPKTDAVNNTNCYLYLSNGVDYVFLDHGVTELYADQSAPNYLSYPELVDPTRDGGSNPNIVDGSSPWAWKIYSAGGVAW